MEINHVHRTSCVRLAEKVKSSTDYQMRFIHEKENNKPEKGSLIHYEKLWTRHKKNKTETNTAPMIAKKKKESYKNKYKQIYSDKWENDKRAQRFKKELDKIRIDKEGSLEWLRRGQISWDGK